MTAPSLHRASGITLVALSGFALLLVATHLGQPPQPDEGTAAHLFQLAIASLAPAGVVFLASADWSRPRRTLAPLLIAGALTTLALVLLYRLEHP